MAVWVCPGCQRRVPDRIGVCHCGTRREQAALVAAASERPREVARPAARRERSAASREGLATAGAIARDAWPYVIVFVLALGGAVVWAAVWRPEVLPPLLGYMGGNRPSPPPPRSAPSARKTP